MRIHRGPGIDATILGAATLFALALGNGNNIVGSPERYDVVGPRAVFTEEVSTTPLVTGGALDRAGERLRKL